MKENNKIVVKVKGVGQDSLVEYKEYNKCIISDRVNACRNLLKIDFARWIQRMLYNTNLNSLEVTDRILDGIELKGYCTGDHSTSNPLLTRIIFGSLYRVSLEASLQNKIEHSDYLNSIYKEVSNTCDNIIYLLNEDK